MKTLASLIIVAMMALGACTPQTQTFENITIHEGEYCLPYSPQGQSVYNAEWTGEFPVIEEQGKNFKTATFGMGCFWGPSAEFAMVDGVIRTRVGYTGGKSTMPSYDDLGNHIEVIEVDYNPAVITYEGLVKAYFEYYDATVRPYSQRVKSVVFYRTNKEKRIASNIKAQVSKQVNQALFTEIDPVDVFYLAESEHQLSYLKKETSLYGEITQIFPDEELQLLSVLASKLNGIIAGFGSEEQVLLVLKDSGLSTASMNRVKEIFLGYERE